MPPFELADRPQARAVGALLGLLLEDVAQPVDQHGRALQVVPEPEQGHDGRVGQGDERVEGDEPADRELARHHLVRADPEEERRGQEGHASGPRRRRTAP